MPHLLHKRFGDRVRMLLRRIVLTLLRMVHLRARYALGCDGKRLIPAGASFYYDPGRWQQVSFSRTYDHYYRRRSRCPDHETWPLKSYTLNPGIA